MITKMKKSRINKFKRVAMKSLMTTFVFVLLLMSNAVTGQDFVFKVLANKGQNTYKPADASDWQPLKTGAMLKSGDQVKTAEGAYLGLYHSSGRTVEVKEAGTHEINKLAEGVSGNKASVTSKYADFVMSKMSESKEDAHANYRKSMGTTGAVDRALASNAAIKMMAHSSTEIVSEQVVIRWNPVPTDDPNEKLTYVVSFLNLFDDVIEVKETDKTFVSMDMNAKNFKDLDSKFVKVKVGVKGYDLVSDEYAITVRPEEEATDLLATLKSLKSEFETESAMTKLVMAAFFEDNNLLLDALTCYEQAIKMEPEVESFRDAYELFLIRNGFGMK
jgi:hypothetical protein